MAGAAGVQERRAKSTLRPIPLDSTTEPPRERERQSNRDSRLHVGVVNGQMTEANNTVSRSITAA